MQNRKLVLENGMVFLGEGFGSMKEKLAEIVFNTSVVGYQEILSDPSYCGQMVVMTYPLIGNYGLTDEDYESKNILLLQKLIPHKTVFALLDEDKTEFCIFHTRLQQSAWMATDEAVITLQGLTLDDVWNNVVAAIGGLDAQAEETIEEQIIHREQREKLLRQIESLEKQCRTEKQTRKKYELHQQIIKLKEKLK